MGVKHRNKLRKLGKSSKHRWAMLRNMVTSLIHHERIETTVPKAMELRRVADNMVTLGKRGDQHAKRQANAVVRDYVALHKLFSDLGLPMAEQQHDRFMLCGSPQMLSDTKAILDGWEMTESLRGYPGEYVIERAFVQK